MIIKWKTEHQQILDFLDAQYVREREQAQWGANMLINVGAPKMGVKPRIAERQAQANIQRAELLQRFLDETIRPHLGTNGALGENADRQLRLLAWGYSDQPGYHDVWQPADQ